MKPSEALRKARQLITPEGAWIKGKWAEDENHIDHLQGKDPGAICFCASGAVQKIKNVSFAEVKEEEEFFRRVTGEGFENYNDAFDRTHAEVLDAFDRAADLAEAEGR